MRYNFYFEPPAGLCDKVISRIRYEKRAFEIRKKIIKLSVVTMLIVMGGISIYVKIDTEKDSSQIQKIVVEDSNNDLVTEMVPIGSGSPIWIRTAMQGR